MQDEYAAVRERLLAEIDSEVRDTARWLGTDRLDPAVRAAMASVPRHEFAPDWERPYAYDNRPLSIGRGQTISQPYIVAAMTQILQPHPKMRVLEVGTGCGYQAAVLASVVAEVWSVERIPDLADAAAERLARLGYGNVHVKTADGSLGWPEHAPYDGILVTAAAAILPQALVDQLAPGGRMVIPVGAGRFEQTLTLVEKDGTGKVSVEPGLPVAFVPLVMGES
ncbi:MAG: protein-L-isoaspartate(D-aspartate) O-methyltransferase [Alphaproteobacteria bacterium]|nr:protein-L-isoaspartate(D-aspartate) O-methyltransferase [Alphaproteobacteria bacterium]